MSLHDRFFAPADEVAMQIAQARATAAGFGLELFHDRENGSYGLRAPGERDLSRMVWIDARLLDQIGAGEFERHYIGEALRRTAVPDDDED